MQYMSTVTSYLWIGYCNLSILRKASAPERDTPTTEVTTIIIFFPLLLLHGVALLLPIPEYFLCLLCLVTYSATHTVRILYTQCCGSKYIEFGSGSRILAHFGSGSKSRSGSGGYTINFERKN